MRCWLLAAWFLPWPSLCRASRHTFRSHAVADSGLTYVKDSGICETTPGVGQMSGYIEVANDASLWFWFFEARNSPDTAPLTLWLNGGPGCSSMIGLFQENGPCTVDTDGTTTVLNPYSWNNLSNMIYIDQPVGAGFSHGTAIIDNTDDAAKIMWNAFQILFESPEFSAFQGRDLIFATESYGAHYGPAFIAYFNAQNALIDSGALTGQKITFTSLMINDGKHDPLIQYASYITFATDAPGYGPLQDTSTLSAMADAFTRKNGCQAQLEECYSAGTSRVDDALCAAANVICTNDIFYPAIRGRDSDDLRQLTDATAITADDDATFPPTYYKTLLRSASVLDAIGATSTYDACNDAVQAAFGATGEFGRSALVPLAALANARFPILIWVGDADIKANWLGVHDAMVSMSWYGNLTLNSTALTNWTLDGTPVASIKIVDSFTFSRVFGGGHNLPSYVPSTALQFFAQVVQKGDYSSTSSSSTATSPAATASPSASSGARGVRAGWGCAIAAVLWTFVAVV
ncbi:alpha/beta-hydrolase [Mycena vulgaris]|nr:alpha/beta-hydrolase [Mycena vulgaris]